MLVHRVLVRCNADIFVFSCNAYLVFFLAKIGVDTAENEPDVDLWNNGLLVHLISSPADLKQMYQARDTHTAHVVFLFVHPVLLYVLADVLPDHDPNLMAKVLILPLLEIEFARIFFITCHHIFIAMFERFIRLFIHVVEAQIFAPLLLQQAVVQLMRVALVAEGRAALDELVVVKTAVPIHIETLFPALQGVLELVVQELPEGRHESVALGVEVLVANHARAGVHLLEQSFDRPDIPNVPTRLRELGVGELAVAANVEAVPPKDTSE